MNQSDSGKEAVSEVVYKRGARSISRKVSGEHGKAESVQFKKGNLNTRSTLNENSQQAPIHVCERHSLMKCDRCESGSE
jgi:hypothetical protein